MSCFPDCFLPVLAKDLSAPRYVWVYQVASFLQFSPSVPCLHLSSPPYEIRFHDKAFPGRTIDTRKPQRARVTSTINFFNFKAVSKSTTPEHQILKHTGSKSGQFWLIPWIFGYLIQGESLARGPELLSIKIMLLR